MGERETKYRERNKEIKKKKREIESGKERNRKRNREWERDREKAKYREGMCIFSRLKLPVPHYQKDIMANDGVITNRSNLSSLSLLLHSLLGQYVIPYQK